MFLKFNAKSAVHGGVEPVIVNSATIQSIKIEVQNYVLVTFTNGEVLREEFNEVYQATDRFAELQQLLVKSNA